MTNFVKLIDDRRRKNLKQAGDEPGQAQVKLGVIVVVGG